MTRKYISKNEIFSENRAYLLSVQLNRGVAGLVVISVLLLDISVLSSPVQLVNSPELVLESLFFIDSKGSDKNYQTKSKGMI